MLLVRICNFNCLFGIGFGRRSTSVKICRSVFNLVGIAFLCVCVIVFNFFVYFVLFVCFFCIICMGCFVDDVLMLCVVVRLSWSVFMGFCKNLILLFILIVWWLLRVWFVWGGCGV